MSRPRRRPAAVARLPVQHPERPHCTACGADLPTFRTAAVSLPACEYPKDKDGPRLLAITITFRVRCACGTVLDLAKSKDVSKEKT